MIAEVAADEASLLIDGLAAGVLAIAAASLPENYESFEVAGFTWDDFRSEFKTLVAGFGVLTHRLERDGHDVPSYMYMEDADRVKVTSALLSDFLTHNALRFGNETSGVMKSEVKFVENDEGEQERKVIKVDADKPKNYNEVLQNMVDRGYSTGVAQHPAAKISPETYKRLRRTYPEIKKSSFDRDVSFYTDVEKELEARE